MRKAKKRISYKNAMKIKRKSGINKIDYLCSSYYLVKESGTAYSVRRKLKLWVTILTYIPALVYTFFDCLWHEGLDTFEFPSREDDSNIRFVFIGNEEFKYCEELWYAKDKG